MSRVVYVIDGTKISNVQDFYELAGQAVGGSDYYFGTDLDSFSDCLSGGFGTPEDDDFEFRIQSSDATRESLGYAETLRWRIAQRARVHPANRVIWDGYISDARHRRGQTVFDILVEIFASRGVTLRLE